jgi:prepilin-type N-terminal cleavage/methylation domain-containing protein
VCRRDGFTLLEVMLAVFVLGIVIGALLELMGVHLSRLADARQELEAARLAEMRLRELRDTSTDGILPEIGRTEGVFEPPNDYLHWELEVEETAVPLPADVPEGPPPSSVFAVSGFAPELEGAVEPSLLRVALRVFPEREEDPESVVPYVLYVVQPVDEETLGALAETLETEDEEQEEEEP